MSSVSTPSTTIHFQSSPSLGIVISAMPSPGSYGATSTGCAGVRRCADDLGRLVELRLEVVLGGGGPHVAPHHEVDGEQQDEDAEGHEQLCSASSQPSHDLHAATLLRRRKLLLKI